jgi:hypothetical protein
MMSRYLELICAAGSLAMTAACGGAPPASDTTVHAHTSADDPARDTRGMVIESTPSTSCASPAAATPSGAVAPFVLEARLRARRTHHRQSITLDEIHSGDTLMNGDRLKLSIRTSRDGYLYLAFCSPRAKNPRYHGLSVFPERGGIPMVANQLTLAPPGDEEIVLDEQPGQEALYLIVSGDELSRADARLADALAAARQGRGTTDCGVPFQAAVSRPGNRNTGGRAWNGRQPKARADGPDASLVGAPELGKPVVDIQRGAYVECGPVQSGVASDPDGVVVLRYDLKHVSVAK